MTDPAEQAILTLLAARGPDKSICPTEAARLLTGDPASGNPADERWRAGLSPVRLAAQRLARAGRLQILRKGKPIDPEALHGVIRLRLAPEGRN